MSKIYPTVRGVVKKDNKVLYIKWQIGENTKWQMPGGKIQFGESPEETLKRELELIPDIKIKDIKLENVISEISNMGQNIILEYSCNAVYKPTFIQEEQMNYSSFLEYRWFESGSGALFCDK